MSRIFNFVKIRDVNSPKYSTIGSAGIDFFYPNDCEPVTISPNQSVLLPSGVKGVVPDGHALIAFNRSGMAAKMQLIRGSSIIDSDYRGEIFFNFHNIGLHSKTINPGDKIIQCVMFEIPTIILKEIEIDDFNKYATDRNDGCLGSTDK